MVPGEEVADRHRACGLAMRCDVQRGAERHPARVEVRDRRSRDDVS